MDVREALQIISDGRHLDLRQAEELFLSIFKGGANPDQVGALLMGLKRNGETAEEIAGAARALKAKAVKFSAPQGTIDICGTGGDGHNTLNISTAAAFVVAACGVPVAKHGNRAVSSQCGSADVLEALGVNIEVEPQVMEHCIQKTHFAFLFAPKYHPVMREMAPIRRSLGVRTIFNLVGPLSNPANVKRQLIGVYSKDVMHQFSSIAEMLGLEKAWIVHSRDGLDEISVFAPTDVEGAPTIDPSDYIENPGVPEEIAGGTAEQNAIAIRKLLLNERRDAFKQAVCLNAAAALVIADKAKDIKQGMQMATGVIEDRAAYDLLLNVIELTNADDKHAG